MIQPQIATELGHGAQTAPGGPTKRTLDFGSNIITSFFSIKEGRGKGEGGEGGEREEGGGYSRQ